MNIHNKLFDKRIGVARMLSCKNPLLKECKFDHYRGYPSINDGAWIMLLRDKVRLLSKDPSTRFYPDANDGLLSLFSLEMSEWDEEHFGFKIGKIDNPVFSGKVTFAKIKNTISSIITDAGKAGAKVLIARVSGDNIPLIHAMEGAGFRYYETIIWPITDLKQLNLKIGQVSYFRKNIDDIEKILNIARNHQYQRGHYHCDVNFEKSVVNEMYAKWITSALLGGKKITIIKDKDKIIGYFVCDIDKKLSDATGYKYGRLQSLAIDSSYHGKGYGKKIFEGTLALLKKDGCRYVDSGYASKNHQSARLHSAYGFSSVFEEITMHMWI